MYNSSINIIHDSCACVCNGIHIHCSVAHDMDSIHRVAMVDNLASIAV